MSNSQKVSLTVLSSDNPSEVRKKIEEKTGESLDNKILMSGSSKLTENKSLSYSNIQNGAEIKVMENNMNVNGKSNFKSGFRNLIYSFKQKIKTENELDISNL